MANETNEPRALSAALSAPSPFSPRVGGAAMHAANRHVERWAPETTASQPRSMRALGFVDRMVAPWIETAQRSASLRLFTHYTTTGTSEREGAAVSWVFPRPWYQDELDWMAAARQTQVHVAQQAAPAPTMFTTRGTFVAPQSMPPQRTAISAPEAAMPSALYEYVAPSLSIAQPSAQANIPGVGYGGSQAVRADAYTSLVPLAAIQAAELMSRAVAPLVRTIAATETSPATMGRVSPALRQMLTTMLERASVPRSDARVAQQAPELVTPPAPRPDAPFETSPAAAATAAMSPSAQLADQYAEQRVRIVELQRIARVSAEREIAVRQTAQAAEAAITAKVDDRATAQRIEETRAAAQQRAVAAQEAARTTQTAQSAAEAERLRVEERVAQRIAERAQESETRHAIGRAQEAARSGRLHEQARAEAAQHARTPLESPPSAPVQTPSIQHGLQTAGSSAGRVAFIGAEVIAAIAALPPELKEILASRPERGVAAIAELGEALRTAELIARSAAANQTFEATRGPRLMMPAGLGGLVSAVERAHVIADRPAQLAQPAMPVALGAQPIARDVPPMMAQRALETRVPNLPWLAGPAPRTIGAPAAAPTTALGATAAAVPAALGHVAWSDRWLARFAGATPRSLDILQAGSAATPELRMQALASAAPESIFVHPVFDVDSAPRSTLQAPAFQPTIHAQPGLVAPMPMLRPSMQPIERFDDNAATPDDVFEQIAAAAAGVRTAAASAPSAEASRPSAGPTHHAPRMMPADAVAHAAPSAPGAGLSAQLSASPFAPALRHVLPMAASATFDIRALFGAGLSATYLAGLLSPAAEELVVHGLASPAWASFATATQAAALGERTVPSLGDLDLAYVAPEAPPSALDAAPSARVSIDEARTAAELPAAYAAPLTTLRTALLSWSVESTGTASALTEAPSVSVGQTSQVAPAFSQMFVPPATSSAARAMSQSMSMPMLGDAMPSADDGGAAWTAPGMIGDRAHGWSVAQERSASDLALDFVAPELVLAARVYGLGPAEAAQAGRLALAGPAQLAAMASTVDRTFVQAMAIATERRESARAEAITTAYPLSAPTLAARAVSAAGAPPAAQSPAQSALAAYEAESAIARADAALLPSSSFGVERRAPRGAFLWPSATVAALGLTAPAPDSPQSMSVAALELLAAQAVAEIGTFAAYSEYTTPGAASTSSAVISDAGGIVQPSSVAGSAYESAATSSAARATGGFAPQAAMPTFAEPAESDVLGAAAAMIPTARRARFDALYVALSQSPSGRSWSPAARAARALALAGRGEDGPVSAYERAATAWEVLPVVYATDGMTVAEIEAASVAGTLPSLARAASRARAGGTADMPAVSARPGMAGLMSRAGEAIGSYVAPSTGELAQSVARSESSSSASAVRERDLPIVHRAPTAAQELVRTGRPTTRSGGGEVEIPSWFESAARKMLDDRSATSSSDGGFSLAELTLVTAAPAAHIAASSRASSHAAAPAPAAAASGDKAAGAPAMDTNKIADDVYKEVLVMMDMARSRNGEPYL